MAKTLFLGVEGSGKTTLAMALVKAFAKHCGEGWYLRPVDRGAYNFATIAPEDFERDGFPRQTANVREMTWRIEKDGEGTGSLEILDYPGEVYRQAFLNADDEPDPVAFRERAQANAREIETLREALASAGSIFVLFNLQDALDLASSDANRGAIWVTNESLKVVKALPSKPKVVLVFTQVDRYQTEDDFLHTFKPTDLDLIGHDHPDIDWTMVSVLVPPDSEFGVDAFVRRCTGLNGFGVPTGRPVNAEERQRGEILKQLSVARKSASQAPVLPLPKSAGDSSMPHVDVSPWQMNRAVIVLASTATLIALLSVLGLMVFFFLWTRNTSSPQMQPPPTMCPMNTNAPGVVEMSPVVTNVPLATVTNASLVVLADAVPATTSTESPAATNAVPEIVASQPPAVVTNVVSAKSQAMATRIASAAWSAWVKAEAGRLQKEELAEARLKEARAAASPQDAHSALCDAAEAGNAEAQYLLARVYDFWGWGGWVRTKAEREKNWLEWSRRIDFEKGATAILVSRPAPNAEEFRRLSLDWYRSASENGVSKATEALERHAALAARKAEAAK